MDVPPMGVRRLEHGRFLVRSERAGSRDEYLVDINEGPYGKCSCLDHSIRIDSYIGRGEIPEKTVCKHVARVRAEIAHARVLCEIAGLEFDERIIPSVKSHEET